MGPEGGAGSGEMYSPTSVDGFHKLQEEVGEGDGGGGGGGGQRQEGGMKFLKPLVASEAFMAITLLFLCINVVLMCMPYASETEEEKAVSELGGRRNQSKLSLPPSLCLSLSHSARTRCCLPLSASGTGPSEPRLPTALTALTALTDPSPPPHFSCSSPFRPSSPRCSWSRSSYACWPPAPLSSSPTAGTEWT